MRIGEEFTAPGRRTVFVDRVERHGERVQVYISLWQAGQGTSISKVVIEGTSAKVRELGRAKNLDVVAEVPAIDLRPRRGEVTVVEDGRERVVRVSFDTGGLENWFIKEKTWQ